MIVRHVSATGLGHVSMRLIWPKVVCWTILVSQAHWGTFSDFRYVISSPVMWFLHLIFAREGERGWEWGEKKGGDAGAIADGQPLNL
jgi:hypothetical protein